MLTRLSITLSRGSERKIWYCSDDASGDVAAGGGLN